MWVCCSRSAGVGATLAGREVCRQGGCVGWGTVSTAANMRYRRGIMWAGGGVRGGPAVMALALFVARGVWPRAVRAASIAGQHRALWGAVQCDVSAARAMAGAAEAAGRVAVVLCVA